MSGYGTGYITRERGRHRLRVPDGKGGHKSAGIYASREEAERMRDVLAVERADRINATTLGEYGARIIERLGLRSVKSARSRWKAVQRAPFADDSLETLTRAEVRDWVRSLPDELSERGTPLSWQSQKHALALLRRVLDEAIEDGYRADNPARGVKLSRREETAEGWTWLTLSEVEAVLSLPLSLEQRTVITVAVYQGLRLGELAALTWERVDLQAGWLVVSASWESATKSGRVRRIPLLKPAAEALRAWLGEAAPSGMVFPARAGRLYSRGYDWGWGDRRAGREDLPTQAGIARRVRFHDLRHTCASHLVSGSWGRTWTLREVGEYLGHTSEDVTRKYAHLAPDALHATAAQTATAPTQPTANPPQSIEGVREAAAQLLVFLTESRRAAQDSNLRPSAPEAEATRAIPGGCGSTDPPRGGFSGQELIATVAEGRPVPQEALDQLAAAVLSEPRALAALRTLTAAPGALSAALQLARAREGAAPGASEGAA